jgi:hypothetical protein
MASSDFLRSVTPAIGEPVVDIVRNRDFFGSPIMPDQREGAAGNRSRAFNVRDPDPRGLGDWLSRGITQTASRLTGGSEFDSGLIDVSPDQLAYLVGTAAGGAGKQVMRTVDAVLALTEGDPSKGFAKAPVFRRYFGGNTDFNNASRYYDQRAKLTAIQNQRKLLYGSRRSEPEAYAEFMTEHKDYYDRGVMRKFAVTERSLRKLLSGKRRIRDRRDKTTADIERMDRLNTRIDDVMVGFNKYYYERFVKGDM